MSNLTVKLRDDSIETYIIEHPTAMNWWAGGHPSASWTGWEIVGNPAHTLHVVGGTDYDPTDIQDSYYPLANILQWWLS